MLDISWLCFCSGPISRLIDFARTALQNEGCSFSCGLFLIVTHLQIILVYFWRNYILLSAVRDDELHFKFPSTSLLHLGSTLGAQYRYLEISICLMLDCHNS